MSRTHETSRPFTRFLFREVKLTVAKPEDRHVVREELDLMARIDYKADILSKTKLVTLPENFHRWQIHHIVPVMFGGTNDPSNLTLIDPRVHKLVHEHINNQTRGMQIGDSRTIRLPFLPGKMWAPTQQPASSNPYSILAQIGRNDKYHYGQAHIP